MSIRAYIKYPTMQINNGMDRTLNSIADLKLNSKMDTNALVIPQPKQETPKRFLTGHKDPEKNLANTAKKQKKTNPTPKECKVCLFLL